MLYPSLCYNDVCYKGMAFPADVSLSPLYIGKTYLGTLPNHEDPDEIKHKAAFQQGLHWLIR